jgi:hypothetical protein
VKKLASLWIFIFLSTNVFGQNEERSMAISVSPLAPIFGGISAMYQLKMTNFLSLTLPANFYYSWWKTSAAEFLSEKSKTRGDVTHMPLDISVGLGARFLLKNEGLNDTFYLEPRLMYGYEQFGYKAVDLALESKAMRISPLLRFGWDWYYDSGFYMSLGLGIGFSYYFNNETTLPPKFKDNFLAKIFFPPQEKGMRVDWDAEFKLGYAW